MNQTQGELGANLKDNISWSSFKSLDEFARYSSTTACLAESDANTHEFFIAGDPGMTEMPDMVAGAPSHPPGCPCDLGGHRRLPVGPVLWFVMVCLLLARRRWRSRFIVSPGARGSATALLLALGTIALSGCHHPSPARPVTARQWIRPEPRRDCGTTACGPRPRELVRGYWGDKDATARFWSTEPEERCDRCPREERLQCTFEGPATARVGGPVILRTTLRNVSDRRSQFKKATPLRVKPEFTPFFNHDYVAPRAMYVECDGVTVPFAGGTSCAGPTRSPTGEGHLTVAPGESISSELDLAKNYPGMRGACLVHWNGILYDRIDPDHPGDLTQGRDFVAGVVVDCNWALVRVEP